MKLLIDECIDERLRLSFPEHDCRTARFAGLAGLKNGRLLEAAEAAGFDVLLTVDRNIPYQQNLSGRRLSVLILCAGTNRLVDLLLLVPVANEALVSIGQANVVTIRPQLRGYAAARGAPRREWVTSRKKQPRLAALLLLLAQLRDHREIFQRGGVALHLATGRDLLQQPAHDLAAAGLGQGVGEADVVRLRQRTDLLGHP